MTDSQAATDSRVEERRVLASAALDPATRIELGQFLTPDTVARFMAGLFKCCGAEEVSILDAGAGVGSLTAALVSRLVASDHPPERIKLTAFEVDPALAGHLEATLEELRVDAASRGIEIAYDVIREDFIESVCDALAHPMIHAIPLDFDFAILNPPYRKINVESMTRRFTREVGMEVNNLYSAFLALSARLLKPNGEMVAITPRSFCNGPYFESFRIDFLNRMSFHHIHVYESRDDAFSDAEVLQENIIFHAVKNPKPPATVTVSSSRGPKDPKIVSRSVPASEIIRPDDREKVIHIIADDNSQRVALFLRQLKSSVADLNLTVSTGRVVDFRATIFLRHSDVGLNCPLIYPHNIELGRVVWPKPHSKKASRIEASEYTADVLIPGGVYVLVKRFSAKEERRRITAALLTPEDLPTPVIGLENHLNYYHTKGNGLPLALARGLVAYLNSSMADTYFRNFNGHTQVNAQDLKRFPYPTRSQLEQISSALGDDLGQTEAVDRVVNAQLGFDELI